MGTVEKTGRRRYPFARGKGYGSGRTHVPAGVAGKTVRYRFFIASQNSRHDGGRTGLRALLAGDAGLIIDTDSNPAELFLLV